jgi:hypothetical protein
VTSSPEPSDALKAERRQTNQLERELRTIKRQLAQFFKINPGEYERLQEAERQKEQLDREIETVFLMADPRHQAIASRLVKEIAALGGDISKFVPVGVGEQLVAKLRKT